MGAEANETIQVRYVAKIHRANLKYGEIYEATICRDNKQIIVITDAHGDEYGYPVSEFELVGESFRPF